MTYSPKLLLPLCVFLVFGLSMEVMADNKSDKAEKSEGALKERVTKAENERDRNKAEKLKRRNRVDGEDSASEKAKEMRSRQDQRKAIKDEYKASGEKVKGKKPWWNFWGDEPDPATTQSMD